MDYYWKSFNSQCRSSNIAYRYLTVSQDMLRMKDMKNNEAFLFHAKYEVTP